MSQKKKSERAYLPATKEDIFELRKDLENKATKQDILKLRKDLEKKADKQDLVELRVELRKELNEKATKKDLEELRDSTKDDIEALARMVQNTMASKEEVRGLNIRMDRVEERLEQTATKKEIEQIVTKEDTIIALLEKRETEEAATTHSTRRLQDTVSNHESRIKKLEKKGQRLLRTAKV